MNLLNIIRNYYTIPDITQKPGSMIPVWIMNIMGKIPENIYNQRLIHIVGVYTDMDTGVKKLEAIIHKLHMYTRVFIEENMADAVEEVYNGFQYDAKDERGMVMQHIDGVGYIISIVHNDIKCRFDYTQEEYIRLNEQYVVCGIAKQEKDYIYDWVKYHINLGYDKIYLFDNNDPDGESYDEMLKEFVDADKLEIINIRGIAGQQVNSYITTYYGVPFKYITYIDIDEFVAIDRDYSDIKDFIDKIDRPDICTGIGLQWHCYAGIDDLDIHKPIWEQSFKEVPYDMRKDSRPENINGWTKSIIRRGYNMEMNEHICWVYYPGSENYLMKFLNCYGELQYSLNGYRHNINEISKQPVYIKHFMFRDIKNIYYNKYLRGHAGQTHDEDGNDGWMWWGWYHNMNYYTDVTPVLTEKEQLFMRHKGMKVNYTFRPDCILLHNKYTKDSTYNAFISNILTNLHHMGNIKHVTVSYDYGNGVTQPDYKASLQVDDEYDFSFLSEDYNNYTGAGIPLWLPESYFVGNDIQEPIVISIGFPLSHMIDTVSENDLKQEMTDMSEFLSKDNVRRMFRDIIEDPGKTFTSKAFIQDAGDIRGWRGLIDEFMDGLGMKAPDYMLKNNTFITSLSQYRKFIKYQEAFTDRFPSVQTSFIVDNELAGYSTPYDAFICTQLAAFDNVIYI